MENIKDRVDAVTKIGDIRLKMGGVQPPPKSVKIEITSKCNLRCKFCALRTREKVGSEDMDFRLFQRITEDMRVSGVEEIGLFYLGESFTNPELLIDCIRWCKSELEFPYVFLTTNGIGATEDNLVEVMSEGLDSLKWSVNSATPEQYKEVTGGSEKSFRKALANIRTAWTVRKNMGFKTMLSASSILYEGAQREAMEELLDNEVRPYVDTHYWLPLYSMAMYKGKIEKDLGYIPNAGNCGRIDEETWEPTRHPIPCWCAITEGHVRVDGGLSACGFGADDRFDMGVLDGTNFMRQWNSAKFVELREAQFRTLEEGQSALKGTCCEVCVGVWMNSI